MTDLSCSVSGCANNRCEKCCRPDIKVSGPDSTETDQTYCANFQDREEDAPQNAVDSFSPNPSMEVHCDVENCAYNRNRNCKADHIDISTTQVNDGQTKTQCGTFRTAE